MLAAISDAPRHDRRVPSSQKVDSLILNLVSVTSEQGRGSRESGVNLQAPAVPVRLRGIGGDTRFVRYTRLAAHTVAESAAWFRARGQTARVRDMTAGAMGVSPVGLSELPESASGMIRLLEQETGDSAHHQAVAAMIMALRTSDAVIVGPLSSNDANAPGMIAHLADLTRHAYRALRPPRELVANPGFAQVARRFQFIQMSYHEARSLAAGAIDIGVLAHRLHQIQGDGGEFAITAFGSHGLLWADGRSWEIDPIGDVVDELKTGAAFCAAWVVTRRLLGATAPKALSYAVSAAANSLFRK
jgi:hypothetical protein